MQIVYCELIRLSNVPLIFTWTGRHLWLTTPTARVGSTLQVQLLRRPNNYQSLTAYGQRC